MYHVALRAQQPQSLNYANLKPDIKKPTIQVPIDNSVPKAPDGFVFYRVQSGDTLVSLSVRFGISQNKIRRYNNKVCFGHRLTHISGKLLLIPVDSTVNLTSDLRDQLKEIYLMDDNDTKNDDNLDDKKYSEPDDNGKYQLKKALMYHAKGLDENRALYYLAEANWNVRKALRLWREDDKWEKQNTVMTTCKLNANEAKELLEKYNWDASTSIRFYLKQQKQLNTKGKQQIATNDNIDNEGDDKITPGITELQPVSTKGKHIDDKKQSLVNNDNRNISTNNSITSKFCCT